MKTFNDHSRRSFLSNSLKTGLLIPFLATGIISCEPDFTNKKLKILILGGTSFLGPHQIAYALTRGHSVSTFTRGITKPKVHQALFEQVEMLVGDRKSDLSALENRKWDVVIDNSGHDVEWTRESAKMLKKKAKLYLYTSSTGVYYPYLDDIIDETKDPVLELPEVKNEIDKLEYDYGIMKANSELAAIEEFGFARTIIVRPTYMIGPADKSNRFIHWPIRLALGGETMVPGKVNDPVQYIDVRDVAEWMIRLIENRTFGTFNAVGPKDEQFIYDFVNEASQAFGVESNFITIPNDEFLVENGLLDLVPWIMPTDNNASSARISNELGIANGLTFRALQTSVKDTHDWWYSDNVTQEQRDEYEKNAASPINREKAIIAKWKLVMNM